MATLLRQAQEMQGRVRELQERLGTLRIDGTAGGGMVTVTVSGQQKVLACKIEPALLEAGDAEVLQDLVVAATNQALDQARETAQDELTKLSGGLDMPGLGDALSKMGFGGTAT
ncbi:MAG: YbaB/EbfC family nucleoid-associated protein [Planctomycetota bacterium]|nr:YbaB/EbfC family nucleoid-associated protein [Planctomycetota bacterium]